MVFFGDGAGQAGPFHESLNIASLWQLPVSSLREQWLCGVHTAIGAYEGRAVGAACKDLWDSQQHGGRQRSLSRAFGDKQGARDRTRTQRPVFIECLTHRLRGHYEGDPAKYRELSQLSEWKKKDPIARFARLLKSKKMMTDKGLQAIESEARARVEEAASFSLSSSWPASEEVATQVTTINS